MKKFMFFMFWGVIVALAVLIHFQENNEVKTAQVATATALPTVTVTPTEKPILKSEIESIKDCGLVLAKVQLATIPADQFNPPSWKNTNLHEVWKIYVFGGTEKVGQMRSDMNINDRWGNEIKDVQYNASLSDIPTTAEAGKFYNSFGYLAGWDTGYNNVFQKSGFCHEVEGIVEWTKAEDLKKFAEFKFDYPEGTLNATPNDNFVAEFFAGKELGWKDFDILEFKAFGLVTNEVNWGSLNFGSTSIATSYFGVDFNNTVQWSYVLDNPNVITSVDTNVFMPLEREVVIKMTYASGKTDYHLMVLHRFIPDNAPTVITIKP